MEQTAINAIRFLGIDSINQAQSGHPGIVLGAAPMLYTLFAKHMQIDVSDTKWINRDRFVLSAGHGSALLYALYHLSGYKISIEDLKRFRKPGNTPGHPEYGHTPGVETTSGPLGQGISNAVGMAIAESHLAAKFNKNDMNIVDHFTYVLCGDGDLQEGVSMEAMSLAGHLGLGKLIVLFDSNSIQLDGKVSLAYSENLQDKMIAMGWQYIGVADGNNIATIDLAIEQAKAEKTKPTLIEVKTIIGFGTTIAGSSKVHGAPIGYQEADILRKNLEWEYPPFVIPNGTYSHFRKVVLLRGKHAHQNWKQLMSLYQIQFPEDYDLFCTYFKNEFHLELSNYQEELAGNADSTRNTSGKLIAKLSSNYKNIIGGSADLTSSTKAKGADGHFSKEFRLGRNINFGVREHAMGAITNGITLHGGLKAFCGGFFVFSDYMKPAIRLASIMQIPSIFVFSHDTIAVGEDGPTHQPIEQLAGLRAIPNLNVIRPADAIETFAAWKLALESKHTPTVIILTRQNLNNHPSSSCDGVAKGAYVTSPETNKLDGILLAAGSEVDLAIKVQKRLKLIGKDVRVISIPSTYIFDQQPKKYINKMLPKRIKVLAIEMGSSMPWYKYTKYVYGIDKFGVSAPMETALDLYGFTEEKVSEYFIKHVK